MLSSSVAPPAAGPDHRARRARPVARVRDAGRRRGLLGDRQGARAGAFAERSRGHRRGPDRAPRHGSWTATARRLASNKTDKNGESYRVYPSRAVSQVVGYASTRYGRAGLELAYDAELAGLAGDPMTRHVPQVPRRAVRPQGPDRSPCRSTSRRPRSRRSVTSVAPSSCSIRRQARSSRWPRRRPTTPPRSRTRRPPRRRSRRCWTTSASRSCPGRPLAATCPARCSRSSPRSPASALGPSRRTRPTSEQPVAEEDGLVVDGFRIRDGHHPETGDTRPRPGRGDRGLVQHLVRPDRARDRRRRPRRLRGAPRVRGADPVRPADRGLAGHQRHGRRARRLQGRRGARERVLRPGRDVRDAAPDGPRREHGRQRRRAHEAASRDGHHRPQRDARDRPRDAPAGHRPRATPRPSPTPWSRPSQGDLGQRFTAGAKVPGVTTAGKSGTAELGGSGEPHSWFIGFAPAEAPKVAIAVLVEQGGRGGEVASPIAGDLMTRYLESIR